MQNLAGKVAVVTGGASGIGHALATRFAAEGMKLVLVDVEAGPLAEAARAFEADGVEVLAQPLDVSDPAGMDALAEKALERFGAVRVGGWGSLGVLKSPTRSRPSRPTSLLADHRASRSVDRSARRQPSSGHHAAPCQ